MTTDRLKELADYIERTGDALFAKAEAEGRTDYSDLTEAEFHEANLLVDLFKLVAKERRLKLLANSTGRPVRA
jgi:hypothetical protein